FHGGVYGKLHNKSVAPHVIIHHAILRPDGALAVKFMRDEGADVYGSFLIGIEVKTADGEVIEHFDGPTLAALSQDAIHNWYVAKVKPGKHSLILPLGALAEVSLVSDKLKGLPLGQYQVKLLDISG